MLTKLQNFKDEREGGFTLIELLVVIGIIGILSAIAIPAFLNQRKSAVDASVQSDVSNASKQIETWMIQNYSKPIQDQTFKQEASASGAVLSPLFISATSLMASVPSDSSNDIEVKVSEGTTVRVFGNGEIGQYCLVGVNSGGDLSKQGITYDNVDGGLNKAGKACSGVNIPNVVAEMLNETPAAPEGENQIPEGEQEGEAAASIQGWGDFNDSNGNWTGNLAVVYNPATGEAQVTNELWSGLSGTGTLTLKTESAEKTVPITVQWDEGTADVGPLEGTYFTEVRVDMNENTGNGGGETEEEPFTGMATATANVWDRNMNNHGAATVSYNAGTGEISIAGGSSINGTVELSFMLSDHYQNGGSSNQTPINVSLVNGEGTAHVEDLHYKTIENLQLNLR